MEEKVKIQIETDSLNAEKEQYKVFQLNGETIEVPIGILVEVPLWVAERAKEIGLIKNYLK